MSSPVFLPQIFAHDLDGDMGWGEEGRESLCGQSQCRKLGDAERAFYMGIPTSKFPGMELGRLIYSDQLSKTLHLWFSAKQPLLQPVQS